MMDEMELAGVASGPGFQGRVVGGYSTDALFRDPRFRLNQALSVAGVQGDYARQAMAQAYRPTPGHAKTTLY